MRAYPGSDPVLRQTGTTAAVTALRGGRLVAAPADFHYAVLADAFSLPGVRRLRELRGIADSSAIPVFIHRRATMHALFLHVSEHIEALAARFWPGPLTIIGAPQPSLAWEAGTAEATAVRMPVHPWILDVIAELGPVAATGAQAPGAPAADGFDGVSTDGLSVGLDAGTLPGGPPSTVVDTRQGITVVREGAIPATAVLAAAGMR